MVDFLDPFSAMMAGEKQQSDLYLGEMEKLRRQRAMDLDYHLQATAPQRQRDRDTVAFQRELDRMGFADNLLGRRDILAARRQADQLIIESYLDDRYEGGSMVNGAFRRLYGPNIIGTTAPQPPAVPKRGVPTRTGTPPAQAPGWVPAGDFSPVPDTYSPPRPRTATTREERNRDGTPFMIPIIDPATGQPGGQLPLYGPPNTTPVWPDGTPVIGYQYDQSGELRLMGVTR